MTRFVHVPVEREGQRPHPDVAYPCLGSDEWARTADVSSSRMCASFGAAALSAQPRPPLRNEECSIGRSEDHFT